MEGSQCSDMGVRVEGVRVEHGEEGTVQGGHPAEDAVVEGQTELAEGALRGVGVAVPQGNCEAGPSALEQHVEGVQESAVEGALACLEVETAQGSGEESGNVPDVEQEISKGAHHGGYQWGPGCGYVREGEENEEAYYVDGTG